MSSARNHARRSRRSYHSMRANTGYSSRKMTIRSYSQPKQKPFLQRFLGALKAKRETRGEASAEV